MKLLFDLFPVILFFIAYKLVDIYAATVAAIIATLIQVGWSWFRHRKVDNLLWVSLVLITIFGGATLFLQDEAFIKWKPTVLYWLFACVLLISQVLFKKNLIRSMLSNQLKLPAAIWSRLNISWSLFFAAMGAVNLYVAFNFSTDFWVNFKLFGFTGLMLIFIIFQGLFIGKHAEAQDVTKTE
ncbi:MAG TPA: septation protein A [Nitrosomonas sp.]|nr:septation protein A [Nitrosomonas sp.]